MTNPTYIIALLTKGDKSVASNGNGASGNGHNGDQRNFSKHPITDDELDSVLFEVGPYAICRQTRFKAVLSLLDVLPEWQRTSFILVDLPTIRAARVQEEQEDLWNAVDPDEEKLPELCCLSTEKIRNKYCERVIVGIYAHHDEGVLLMAAGCDKVCSLHELPETIRHHVLNPNKL